MGISCGEIYEVSVKFLERVIYIIVIISASIIGYILYLRFNPVQKERSVTKESLECVTSRKEILLKDKLMQESYVEGTEFQVLQNYYKCNPILRNDIVMFRVASDQDSVMRIVRGIPGDRVELSEDKEKKAWNIKINGEYLSFRQGKYFFGSLAAPPPLQLYLNENESVLQPGYYLLFSSVAPGGQDSSAFGVVEKKAIEAKALPLQNQ